MLKYAAGIGVMVLLCGAFFMTAGCATGNAKGEYILGKDIVAADIKDFYYTIDSSANPPLFQRYRFTNAEGKYSFYHEKREGNTWPLREKHITVQGTVTLSEQQWQEFCGYIKDGRVTKRTEEASTGGHGPWLYLYWKGDKGKYQVYEFASLGQKKQLEELCLKLKEQK